MVSYNTPKNGEAHRGVQHVYFRVGVVDRGKFYNFFSGRSLDARKKAITDQNDDINVGRVQKYLFDQ